MNGKRILKGLLSVGLLAAFLTGCGDIGKKKTDDSQTGSEGKEEIRISWWGGDSRHEAMREAINAFEKENPEIKVKAEYSGFDSYESKLTTQLSGGTAPDVIRVDAQWLDKYKGSLVDLNDMTDEIEMDKFDKNTLGAATIEDKLLGMPLSTIYMPLYYNKTAFEEYGLEVPKTWEDIIAMKEKLPEDVYPLSSLFGPKVATSLFLAKILSTQTGKGFSDESNTLLYTEEDILKAVEYYHMLVEKKIVPSKKILDNAGGVDGAPNPGLVSGKHLMFFQWDSSSSVESSHLEEAGYELALAGFPTMSGNKSNGNFSKPSAVYSIPSSSKHSKEAAKLINYLLTSENAIKATKLENGFPDTEVGAKVIDDLDLATPLQKESHELGEETNDPSLSQIYKWQTAKTDDASLQVFTKLDYGEIDTKEAAKLLYDAYKERESELID